MIQMCYSPANVFFNYSLPSCRFYGYLLTDAGDALLAPDHKQCYSRSVRTAIIRLGHDTRNNAASTAADTINNNIEIKDKQENSCTPPAPGRYGVVGLCVAFFYP